MFGVWVEYFCFEIVVRFYVFFTIFIYIERKRIDVYVYVVGRKFVILRFDRKEGVGNYM